MDAVTILIPPLAVACVIWYVVASMLIFDYLHRRGHKVSFIWLRLMLPSYASRYRQETKRETGHVGGLFYHWVISINLALVLTLIAIAVHRF